MIRKERWLAKNNGIIAFIVMNHRSPSKYNAEERIGMFERLMVVYWEYRRVTQ